MKLLILRHAESEGNASGNYSTAQADSLSIQGEQQARDLVKPLTQWHFDKIITSPLQRALQTVAPYLAATGQTADIWPELAEACWHADREAPTMSWRSQPDSLPNTLAHLFTFRDGHAAKPAYPESFGTGLRRVHACLDLIHNRFGQSSQTILMATHGHFIREFLNLIQNKDKHPAAFEHDNCGATLVSFNGGWTMEFCNQQIHMHASGQTHLNLSRAQASHHGGTETRR